MCLHEDPYWDAVLKVANPDLVTWKRRKPRPFWDRVAIGEVDQCWPYQMGHSGNGYPLLTFMINGTKHTVYAHRVALELHLGRPLRPGMCACHRCDNPLCCNPHHLFEGTQQDNILDAVRKGRHNRMQLKPMEARDVRERYARGATMRELADAYEVGVDTIYRVLTGLVHRDVGGPIRHVPLNAKAREKAPEVIALRGAGHAIAAIAAALRMHQTTVARVLAEYKA